MNPVVTFNWNDDDTFLFSAKNGYTDRMTDHADKSGLKVSIEFLLLREPAAAIQRVWRF